MLHLIKILFKTVSIKKVVRHGSLFSASILKNEQEWVNCSGQGPREGMWGQLYFAIFEMDGCSEDISASPGSWRGMTTRTSHTDVAHCHRTSAERALHPEGTPRCQCLPLLILVQSLSHQACPPCSPSWYLPQGICASDLFLMNLMWVKQCRNWGGQPGIIVDSSLPRFGSKHLQIGVAEPQTLSGLEFYFTQWLVAFSNCCLLFFF